METGILCFHFDVCLRNFLKFNSNFPTDISNQSSDFNTDAPREIKVLTYNMFLRPPGVKNNADDFKNERFQAFLKEIENFDIVCLQEIFSLGNIRQRKLIRFCEQNGFPFHVRSSPPNSLSLAYKFVDAGLLIISRFPIVERDRHIYTQGNQVDEWTSKQVIYAKIQLSRSNFLNVYVE